MFRQHLRYGGRRRSFIVNRMGGRAVEGSGLENRRACKRTVGSNPTPSAILLAYPIVTAAYFLWPGDRAPVIGLIVCPDGLLGWLVKCRASDVEQFQLSYDGNRAARAGPMFRPTTHMAGDRGIRCKSPDPDVPVSAQGQRASGGRLMRMASTFPPVFKPNSVPRSWIRLNST
jgi:hypothetical protein